MLWVKKKKSPYMEFAEVMTSVVDDMKVISEKTNKAFKMLETLPDPVTDQDEAIRCVIDGTSEVLMGSLENVLKILEYYEIAKYAVKRNV
jgi:hypothetical protein